MPTREVEEELGDLPKNAYLSDFSSRFGAGGLSFQCLHHLLVVGHALACNEWCDVCKLYIGISWMIQLHEVAKQASWQGDMDLEEIVSAHCARLQTQRPWSTDLQSSESVFWRFLKPMLRWIWVFEISYSIYNVAYLRNIKIMDFHSFSEVSHERKKWWAFPMNLFTSVTLKQLKFVNHSKVSAFLTKISICNDSYNIKVVLWIHANAHCLRGLSFKVLLKLSSQLQARGEVVGRAAEWLVER